MQSCGDRAVGRASQKLRSIADWGKGFVCCLSRSWDEPSLLLGGYLRFRLPVEWLSLGLFSGVKRPGREAGR